MLDNNQEKGIALSFIVHFQLLLSLFTLNFMASKSAEKFFEFKSANTSKKTEIDTDIPMTVEEA